MKEIIRKTEDGRDSRVTPDEITALLPEEVFVFGSNTMGRHGKGAAKTALKWGARMGHGEGLSGSTYGIPTKGTDLRRSLPLDVIDRHVRLFSDFAKANPLKTFLVTEIGCGLAGYHPKDIAPMFWRCSGLPNVFLPRRFWRRLKQTEHEAE